MEKLKQKVASSSSRVIASLQQAATGTFQQQQYQQQQQMGVPSGGRQAMGHGQVMMQAATVSCSSGQQGNEPPQSGQWLAGGVSTSVSTSTGANAGAGAGAGAAEAPPSAARLIAADATAHLTEKEREILLQVFKKEEQFQRDTIK